MMKKLSTVYLKINETWPYTWFISMSIKFESY